MCGFGLHVAVIVVINGQLSTQRQRLPNRGYWVAGGEFDDFEVKGVCDAGGGNQRHDVRIGA